MRSDNGLSSIHLNWWGLSFCVFVISGLNNDIVNLVPMLGVWMLPKDFLPVLLINHCVSDHQVVFSTFGEKESSIGVVPDLMYGARIFSHKAFPHVTLFIINESLYISLSTFTLQPTVWQMIFHSIIHFTQFSWGKMITVMKYQHYD